MILPTITIKTSRGNKEYVLVKDRVKAFRNDRRFVGWRIETEIITATDSAALFKASIYNKEGVLIATGHAREARGDGYINKTSFVENAETSAVGRALAYIGIGIDENIASADEMTKVKTPAAPSALMIELNELLYGKQIAPAYRSMIELNKEGATESQILTWIDSLKPLPGNIVREDGGRGNMRDLDDAIKDAIKRDKS